MHRGLPAPGMRRVRREADRASEAPASCIRERIRRFAERRRLTQRATSHRTAHSSRRLERWCPAPKRRAPGMDDRNRSMRTHPTARAFRGFAEERLDARSTDPSASERHPMPRSAEGLEEQAPRVLSLIRASGAPGHMCRWDPACTPPTKAGTTTCCSETPYPSAHHIRR